MPRFFPEPAFRHDSQQQTAILLVNLGTPDAPTPSALRRYLKEFLSDPRVVEIPKPIWWLILNGIILNIRPRKSALKYASIWMDKGSPLRVHTESQAHALAHHLHAQGHQVMVRWAMRYGQPSISSQLDQLKAAGARRILIVPMYPQYAASTTATVVDETAKWLMHTRNQPEIRFVRNYHDDAGYLAALEHSVRQHWAIHGPLAAHQKLVMSFHGLPQRSLELGDPYHCECHKTGRLLAERLGLAPGQALVCFQSRFGKAAWLQPYTAPTLEKLAKSGVDRVDMICPGFSADCLETLEEIAMEGKQDFLNAGGKTYHYIPALNAQPAWIEALGELCLRHLSGWPTEAHPGAIAAQACADRAKALGARQ